VHEPQDIPSILEPTLNWCRAHIEKQLNGLLLNWYDGALGHRIGAHGDDENELVVGAPIVTISYGESRIFRLRKYKGDMCKDVEVTDGNLIIPYDTNLAFKHAVTAPKSKKGPLHLDNGTRLQRLTPHRDAQFVPGRCHLNAATARQRSVRGQRHSWVRQCTFPHNTRPTFIGLRRDRR
jgi:2-oxoglutarate-Fe(II)-dependent oxygenase superfamily protein